MADSKLTLTLAAKDAASKEINKVTGALDRTGRSSSGLKGHLGNAGAATLGFAKIAAAAAIGGIGLLAVAMAGAAKAAMDEEVNIARLDKALAGNVKGWDGNRDAIEKVIDARTRLAFDDGALRDSLATLVTRTNDVTKAFDLQAIAMGLARAKNIDLQTASEIIGKVYDGNLGILSRYGIALDGAKTGTEALAKIQESTKGQAEAYGNTTKGAFDKIQIAMGNVVEDVGAALLPKLAELATFLSDEVIPKIKEVIGKIQQWFDDNKELVAQIGKMVEETLKALLDAIGFVVGKIGEFVNAIVSNEDAMNILKIVAEGISIAFGLAKNAVVFVVDQLGKFVDWITSNEGLMLALRTTADLIAGAFQAIKTHVDLALIGLDKLAQWIRDNIGGLRDLLKMLPGIGVGLAAEDIAAGLQGKAIGGSIRAGQPYMVGERGPELFVPQSSGRVVPSGGSGVTIASGAIVINGAGRNAREIAGEVIHEIERRMTQQRVSSLVKR